MQDQELNKRFQGGVGKVMMYAGSLKLFLIMLGIAAVILVNGTTLRSPIVGVGASLAYLAFGSHSLKKVFRGKHRLVNLALGGLLLIVFLALVGWVFTISYKLGVIEVFITLCVGTIFVSLVRTFIKDEQIAAKTGRKPTRLFVRFAEIIFLALSCLQFLLLLQSRTTIPTIVWDSLNPWAMPVFFLNTMLLVVVMFSGERSEISLLLIIIQSTLLHMFFVVVFDAGYGEDQWEVLGWTRRLFDESSYPQNVRFHIQSPFPLLYKIHKFLKVPFQPALSTVLSRMFYVDVYWGHLLLVPLTWGIFVPVIAYRTTEIIAKRQRLALLSALLTFAVPPLILWGAVSVPNSLGYLMFFFTICILLDYLCSDRTVLWAALSSFITFLAHLLPGIMAFSFLFFAYAFKRYQNSGVRERKIVLACSFLSCLSILPIALYSGRLAYPALTGADFSLEPLEGLPVFDAVMLFLFGAYANVTFDEAVVRGLIGLFGLLGLLYVNMTGNRFVRNKELSRFLLLVFIIVELDYRIAECFMVKVPFGTVRIWVLKDILAIPFASIFIYQVIAILSNVISKSIFFGKKELKDLANGIFSSSTVRAMTALCLSALILSSVYLGYPTSPRSPSRAWLTSNEVEAARFIDSTTIIPYVVVCYTHFRLAGYSVVGVNNPRAYYSQMYDSGWLKRLFDKVGSGSPEAAMIEAAEVNNASVVYFVTNKLRLSDADKVIEKVSERPDFELYMVFEDLYIFKYVIPSRRFVVGTGPSVYIYSHQEYVNSSYLLDLVTYEAKYTVELVDSDVYNLTQWPNYWSFESITPRPDAQFMDANLWINFTGKGNVKYVVSWTAWLLYQQVSWKDDSFITGWSRKKMYGFEEAPNVTSNGDILELRANFRLGSRELYWIQKNLNISTDLFSDVLVRWKSTSTCAIAWVYYSEGPGDCLVFYGSYSKDWTTTVVRLPKGKTIEYIMVGLDDYTGDTGGVHSVYFDFVMLANYTKFPIY